jgi:hypothetical protein
MSSCASMILLIKSRMSAESSTTKTLIRFISSPRAASRRLTRASVFPRSGNHPRTST